ncbi:twin-arginine translocation signal domain-containing protein [Piscinibacter sp.]|uniref:twin-arginine translocation signal domain-containing protein n=1 Tax=Piscinibacter sp. TaxID=1903157 RepID=UPI002C69718D|nr:twin-arginine translocation signal domain-containing protein [Albitalea sp.]HUG22871.1 twin-arginine translocation signal domain-containing protein [Albitalea sp.]
MRTIPIGRLAPPPSSACGEDSGEVPKLDLPLARREFLKGSGVLMGTLTAGTLLATLAPSPVWALELKTLSKTDGQTLLAMGRVLYPHKKLPEAVYALLVKDLDAKAAADASAAKQIRDGIAALDQAAGGSFVKASAPRKLALVKAIEGQPFFNTVRGQCITSLYDNDMAYAAFGYPGSAWDKGGYITRGFQDLKWLPAPSAEASPPSFIG